MNKVYQQILNIICHHYQLTSKDRWTTCHVCIMHLQHTVKIQFSGLATTWTSYLYSSVWHLCRLINPQQEK